MPSSHKPQLRVYAGQPVVSTHHIAAAFGRRHSRTLEALRRVGLDRSVQCVAGTYTDAIGQTRPCYLLTCRGFEMLTWRWRRPGDKALRATWLSTWQGMLAQRDPDYVRPEPYFVRLKNRPKKQPAPPTPGLPAVIHPQVSENQGRLTVDSPQVAEQFHKKHEAVYNAIQTLIDRSPKPFAKEHFTPMRTGSVSYYRLDEVAFTLLTARWYTPHALQARQRYLVRFAFLRQQRAEVAEQRRLVLLNQEREAWRKAAEEPASVPAIASTEQSPPTGLQTIEFHGQSLFLIEKEGEPYVPMKPVVEGMGLAWGAQFVKINQRFGSTVSEIETVGQDGKQRSMICMPLKKLPGWLYTIYPNKVRPDLRDTIIQYQEECDEVLWKYWTQGQATNPRIVVPPTPATSTHPTLPDPRVLLPSPPRPRFIDKARAVALLRDQYVAEHGQFTQEQLADFIDTQGYSVSRNHVGLYLYTADTLATLLPQALEAGLGRSHVHSVRQIQSTWSQWWAKFEIDAFYGTADSVFSTVATRLDQPTFQPVTLIPSLEREACALMDMSPEETTLALAWPPTIDKARWH